MTKYLNAFGGENNSDNNINEVTKPLSKLYLFIAIVVENKMKMEEFYDKHLVRYKPKNDIKRNVLNIYKYIHDLIIDITEYHRDYNVDQSSKMDSLTKGKKKNNVNIEHQVSEVVCDDNMVHDN
ncbi:unnamed protein product [Mucor hiemalis]